MCSECDRNIVKDFFAGLFGVPVEMKDGATANGSPKQGRETPNRIQAKAEQFDALVAGLTSIGRKPCCEKHAAETLLSELARERVREQRDTARAKLADVRAQRDEAIRRSRGAQTAGEQMLREARAQRDTAEALRKAEVDRNHTVAAELAALREEYQKTCELVAQMHAAATGRAGAAPTLGVVEDVAAVAADRDRLAEANATAQRDREAMGRRLAERVDEVGQLTEQLRQAKAGNIDGALRGGILRGGQW